MAAGCRFGSSTCRRNSALGSRQVPIQSRLVPWRAAGGSDRTASRDSRPTYVPSHFRLHIAASLLVHVPAHAQGIVYEVFGTYLDSLREQAGIPGLAAAIVDARTHRVGGGVWLPGHRPRDCHQNRHAFNADGLTQVFTAAMVLRCAEERSLSLDDPVGVVQSSRPPSQTLRSGSSSPILPAHQDLSLSPFVPSALRRSGRSFAPALSIRIARRSRIFWRGSRCWTRFRAPISSRRTARPKACPIPMRSQRYTAVLQRRATPYAVDGRGRAVRSTHPRSAGSADAVDRPHHDGSRSCEVRPRAAAGDSRVF